MTEHINEEGINYLYADREPSLDELQIIRKDMHLAVERVLGFQLIGSMPSEPSLSEMNDQGVTSSIYEDVFNTLARIRMKYDPLSKNAFGSASQLKIPERFRERSEEMRFGRNADMWEDSSSTKSSSDS